MAGVSFENVYKRFPGDVVAVNDFSLEIEDKEFVVLVGPSGCGKSTLLRMVAGLEEISEGEIYIDGLLVNDVEPKDRDIAMVFQNYALYPHMSVYENMAFSLKLRKVPKEKIQEKVEEAARILGIEDLLSRKPKALSGGQRQRVALGRAIVRNPKVFLMDEPLSNLDAKLRVQTRSEITKLHKTLQTTFIYVTHDQTEAMTMGDRIIIMKDGFVQQVATPTEVYENPNNIFVASFIGSPQMNFNNVLVKKDGDRIVLEMGRFKLKLSNPKLESLLEKEYLNREIVMGIRPGDIHTNREKDESQTAKIDIIEMLGSEKYLYVNVDEYSFVIRVDASNESEQGDNIQIHLDTEKLHLFDKGTEKSILFNLNQ